MPESTLWDKTMRLGRSALSLVCTGVLRSGATAMAAASCCESESGWTGRGQGLPACFASPVRFCMRDVPGATGSGWGLQNAPGLPVRT